MAQQIYNLPSGFPLSGSERAPFSLVASDGHLTPEMLHHWHTSAAFVAISAASQTIAPKIRLVLWTGSGTGTATLTAIGDALNQVPLGTQIEILSRGSGALTVKGSDGSTIATVANGEHCILTARTAPATWVARKLVLDTDPRLTDARAPTAHVHDLEEVAGLEDALAPQPKGNGGRTFSGDGWYYTSTGGQGQSKYTASSLAEVRALICPTKISSFADPGNALGIFSAADVPGDATFDMQLLKMGSGSSYQVSITLRKTGGFETLTSAETVPLDEWVWVRAKQVSVGAWELWINDKKCTFSTNGLTNSAVVTTSTDLNIGVVPGAFDLVQFCGIINQVQVLTSAQTDAEWATFLRTGFLNKPDLFRGADLRVPYQTITESGLLLTDDGLGGVTADTPTIGNPNPDTITLRGYGKVADGYITHYSHDIPVGFAPVSCQVINRGSNPATSFSVVDDVTGYVLFSGSSLTPDRFYNLPLSSGPHWDSPGTIEPALIFTGSGVVIDVAVTFKRTNSLS